MGKNGVRINLYDLQIYYFYDEQWEQGCYLNDTLR